MSNVREEPQGRTYEDVGAFALSLPARGALIGIDAGTKTLGLALSDITRLIASPLETIRRTKFTADAARLLALTETHKLAGLVLGLPVNLDGSEIRARGHARLRAQPEPHLCAARPALGRAPVDGRSRTRCPRPIPAAGAALKSSTSPGGDAHPAGGLDRMRRIPEPRSSS